MRAIRFLVIAVILALAFTACEKDDNGIDPGTGGITGGDIAFNIGFAPQTRTSTGVDFKTTFVDGDAIGIFAVKRAATATKPLLAAGNYFHNVKLTYSAGGDKWIAENSTLTYPGDGQSLDFYAYYPYDVAATNPINVTFNVAADQSTADNYNASDLLMAKKAGIPPSTTPVDLIFAHKLALVDVEVLSGQNERKGSGPSADLMLSLRGCVTGGTFNLATEVITTTDNVVTVKMLRVEQPSDDNYATNYSYRALVPAQTVPKDTKLFLMTQNGQLFYTPMLSTDVSLTIGAARLYSTSLPITAVQTAKILAGTFTMGSPEGEAGRADNEGQHTVTLTKDYYISKYPITFAQYDAYCAAQGIQPPSDDGWGRDNHPVINVSWNDTAAYCDWMNTQGDGTWRLPTEAEWEYACRAGTTTIYSFGDQEADLINYAWYEDNSSGRMHPVGSKSANAWGLYDMHGNVMELCNDMSTGLPDNYSSDPATDPIGEGDGSEYIIRGGAFDKTPSLCRSASRDKILASNSAPSMGFRVVFVP